MMEFPFHSDVIHWIVEYTGDSPARFWLRQTCRAGRDYVILKGEDRISLSLNEFERIERWGFPTRKFRLKLSLVEALYAMQDMNMSDSELMDQREILNEFVGTAE